MSLAVTDLKSKIAELRVETDALLSYTNKLTLWKEFTADLLNDFKDSGGDVKNRWAILSREINESL
jgi:hypothetical protein